MKRENGKFKWTFAVGNGGKEMEKRMSLCIEKNGEIIGIAGCEEERMEIEFVVGDGECVIERMRD